MLIKENIMPKMKNIKDINKNMQKNIENKIQKNLKQENIEVKLNNNKTKKCIKCNIEKELKEFRFDGKYYRNKCKKCENELNKINHELNKEKIKEYNRKYRKNNKEYFIKKRKEYREKHKEELSLYNKIYYQENKKLYKKLHNSYVQKNKEKIKEYNKKWKKENPEKVKEMIRKDYIKRRNDPVLKLKDQTRNMINDCFKRKNYRKQNSKLESIVCCSIDELINHLLQTFKNNYGYEWDGRENVHIDHIIPLKNAKTRDEVIKLNHYTNLQLLKAKDNLKKGSKVLI